MEGPVLVLSHEEWSPGEWGLYCYALLFSTTQHLVFNIPFNIILLIFSAPFFHFSLSLTQGMGRGTLLLRSIIFNNPTPLFNIPFNIFLLIFSALYCYAQLFSTTQHHFLYCRFSSLSMLSRFVHFLSTRPKPAFGRQGLDWDRWARIQFSQVHFGAFCH